MDEPPAREYDWSAVCTDSKRRRLKNIPEVASHVSATSRLDHQSAAWLVNRSIPHYAQTQPAVDPNPRRALTVEVA
ncbi:hypothetical protein GCM10027421_01310 [Microbacterium shaanxiense]